MEKRRGCRRRLTLAPTVSLDISPEQEESMAAPQSIAGDCLDSEETTRGASPASSLGTSYPKRRFSAPTKFLADEPLCTPKSQPFGSRFWVLGSEDNSESEVEELEEGGVEQGVESEEILEGDFIQRALRVGFTVDEVVAAGESLLCLSSSRKARSVSNLARTRKGRRAEVVVDAVISNRARCKPWRGPLPKARPSQQCTFEDYLFAALEKNSARDLRPAVLCPAGKSLLLAGGTQANLEEVDGDCFFSNEGGQEDIVILAANPSGGSWSGVITTRRFGLGQKLITPLGRLLSRAGSYKWATQRKANGCFCYEEEAMQQTTLTDQSTRKKSNQREGGHEGDSGGSKVEGKNKAAAMAWRGDGGGGCWGYGAQGGDGASRHRRDGEEGWFGGNLGFAPGTGPPGNRGRFHPRGARSFGRRGGFVGRPGRQLDGWKNRGFGGQQQHGRFQSRGLHNQQQHSQALGRLGSRGSSGVKGDKDGKGEAGGSGGTMGAKADATLGEGSVRIGDMAVGKNKAMGRQIWRRRFSKGSGNFRYGDEKRVK
uniref:Uncharacterized protein n=1 Tax=Oryza barthii TaxID=65489 RepID=A0A0D3HQY3_9ORYZ